MPGKTQLHRPDGFLKTSSAVLMALLCTSITTACLTSAYTPVVNHRAIAGLWKLKQTPDSSPISYPLKEFTVYPKVSKKAKKNINVTRKEVLLMLREDGSFQQYSDQEHKVPDKLRFFDSVTKTEKANDHDILDRYCEFGNLKGKWNLIGGRLILAADRPISETGSPFLIPKAQSDVADTILEGEVIATMEEGLSDNPVLSGHDDTARKQDDGNTNASSNHDSKAGSRGGHHNDARSSRPNKRNRKSVLDTHLSVPKGQVNVGRFTYPQHHPSFFEAPMFNPRAGGKFELKQVLGTLNTQQQEDDEKFEEMFSASDFYNKTFLLTSHPIPEFRPKGNIRWSIKYNKFVEDPPQRFKKDEEKTMDQPVHNIRVLEVIFFANNTFATTGGMGGSAILRGKFSVIGKEKDHIWMQVIRFGFGRSVSGSVFSEGNSLTNDDEKAYWGKIKYDDNGDQLTESSGKSRDEKSIDNDMISKIKIDNSKSKAKMTRRLRVKGSVLFGYGLEPLPVGQFVLTETSSVEEHDSNEEDEEDEDEGNDDLSGDSFSFDPDSIFQ